MELNQVAAGIGEDCDDHRPRVCRLAKERNAEGLQPLVLARDIGGLESGQGYALLEHGLLKGLGGWVRIGFQREFEVIGPFRRGDRDPFVCANGNLVFLAKAQHFGVEPQCFILIVNHDAGEFDSHGRILAKHSSGALLEKCEKRMAEGG